LETGVIAFAAVGIAGLSGAIVAGRLADRVGRTTTTSAAMVLSSACCVASPWVYLAPTAVVVAVLVVWGASVIADSAQFSASVTELTEARYSGSALTLQLALGFALTIASIRLVPLAGNEIGWRFALMPLAVGPLVGTVAMLRLRALPAARRLAHGRR
jgi:MFS family permease